MDNEISEIESFFEKNIKDIVNNLFYMLEKNNIDVNVERTDLGKEQLKAYQKIYHNYEKELLKIKREGIKRFGKNPHLDFIFGMTIQKLVVKKQEL